MSDLYAFRVSRIGTGVMGGPMCRHLIDAGADMTVSNRTRAKAEALLAAGASWAETPREAAQAADLVFTIVGYPNDVREVYFGPDGIIAGVGGGGGRPDGDAAAQGRRRRERVGACPAPACRARPDDRARGRARHGAAH